DLPTELKRSAIGVVEGGSLEMNCVTHMDCIIAHHGNLWRDSTDLDCGISIGMEMAFVSSMAAEMPHADISRPSYKINHLIHTEVALRVVAGARRRGYNIPRPGNILPIRINGRCRLQMHMVECVY